MPFKERMSTVTSSYVGKTECFCHDGKTAGFAALDYRAEFQDQSVPVQLMLTECTAFDGEEIDDFLRSQIPPRGERRYTRQLPIPCSRLICLRGRFRPCSAPPSTWTSREALSELYPDCEAFYFPSLRKLFASRRAVRGSMRPRAQTASSTSVSTCAFSMCRIQRRHGRGYPGYEHLLPAGSSVPFPRYELELGCESRLQCGRLSAWQRKRNCGRETVDGVVDGEMSSELLVLPLEDALIQAAERGTGYQYGRVRVGDALRKGVNKNTGKTGSSRGKRDADSRGMKQYEAVREISGRGCQIGALFHGEGNRKKGSGYPGSGPGIFRREKSWSVTPWSP